MVKSEDAHNEIGIANYNIKRHRRIRSLGNIRSSLTFTKIRGGQVGIGRFPHIS